MPSLLPFADEIDEQIEAIKADGDVRYTLFVDATISHLDGE